MIGGSIIHKSYRVSNAGAYRPSDGRMPASSLN